MSTLKVPESRQFVMSTQVLTRNQGKAGREFQWCSGLSVTGAG